MADEKLVARIRKMLELGTHSETPEAEAEAALRMAQVLLYKHNLCLEDVIDSAAQVAASLPIVKRYVGTQLWYNWSRMLAGKIASTALCKLLISADKKGYILIGREDNIAVAEELISWIIGQVQGFCEDAAFRRYINGKSKSERNAFCYAAACRIIERLRGNEKALEAAAPGSTALATRNDTAIAVFMAEHYPRLGTPGKFRVHMTANASQYGRLAGDKVNLSVQKRLAS